MSKRAQPDLGGIFRVGFGTSDPSVQQSIANQLQALPLVEYVQAVSSTPPPPADIPPTTPLYEHQQFHYGALPGFDFAYANGLGLTGQGMRFVDIEYCWVLGHEDIVGRLIPEPEIEPTYGHFTSYCFHGIAATGVITSMANAYGMKGAAPDAVAFVHPEHGRVPGGAFLQRRAEAIATGQQRTSPGDVLMLEMQQCFGPSACTDCTDRCGPAEIELAVWIATRVAVDAGRVVVAAAGNGGVDLDSSNPHVAEYRQRGDSGAIIVGAGTGGSPSFALGFSTFGSRVDLQGWGQNVATLGYWFPVPGAPNDERQTYTPSFSGTSSATPLVSASVLLTQQRAKALFGGPMSPTEIRRYLRATGNAQGQGQPHREIGPQPSMRSAIDRLGDADVGVTAIATGSAATVAVDNLGPSRARQLVIDVAIYSSSLISLQRVDSSPAVCVGRPDPPGTFCAGVCSYYRCTYPALPAGSAPLVWQCTGPPGATGTVEAQVVSGTHADANSGNNASVQTGPLCADGILK